jgi:hypothetical protein
VQVLYADAQSPLSAVMMHELQVAAEPVVLPVVEPVVLPVVEPVVLPVVEPVVLPVVEPVVLPVVELVPLGHVDAHCVPHAEAPHRQLPIAENKLLSAAEAALAQVFSQAVSPEAQLPRQLTSVEQPIELEHAFSCDAHAPPVPSAMFSQVLHGSVPVVEPVEPVEPVVLPVEPVLPPPHWLAHCDEQLEQMQVSIAFDSVFAVADAALSQLVWQVESMQPLRQLT